jgi:hypothetical protein
MTCPSCGTENSAGQKFCGECGGRLNFSCPHCSFENPSGFRFCGECGASLAASGKPQAASSTRSLDQGEVEGRTSKVERPRPSTPSTLRPFDSSTVQPFDSSTVLRSHTSSHLADPSIRALTGATQDERYADAPRYTLKYLAEKILNSRGAMEGERKQVTVLFADVKGSMDIAEQMDPEEWSRIMQRFFQFRKAWSVSRGSSTSSPATASWRCSARRLRTRTMRSGPAMQRSGFAIG